MENKNEKLNEKINKIYDDANLNEKIGSAQIQDSKTTKNIISKDYFSIFIRKNK
jgi:hypothetical protein